MCGSVRNPWIRPIAISALAVALTAPAGAGGKSFTIIEEMTPDGFTRSIKPFGLSGSGRFVVGEVSTSQGTSPAVWSRQDGIVELRTDFSQAPPQVPERFSEAWPVRGMAISDDGQIVVGVGGVWEQGVPFVQEVGFRMVRVAGDDSARFMPDPAEVMSGESLKQARALDVVRAGGSTLVVGVQQSKATLWIDDAEPVTLPALGDPEWPGEPVAFSADGRFAVGRSDASTGSAPTRWDLETRTPELIGQTGFANRADDVSIDGSVIVGTMENPDLFGSVEAFRWTAATGMVGLGGISPDFGSLNALVSGDGSMVFVEAFDPNGDEVAAVWTAEGGMRPLTSFLQNELGIALPDDLSSRGPIAIRRVTGVSTDGATITGVLVTGKAFVAEISCLDSDDDGLCDDWELAGIDINGDGVIDLPIHLWGAAPDRKDLFVEIDAAPGFEPLPETITMIEQAFAGAPVDAPDGVRIHLLLDTEEQMVSPVPIEDLGSSVEAVAADLDPWVDFNRLKSAHYGTPTERGSSNWEAIEAARQASFRYMIFTGLILGGRGIGMAEIMGDDAMFGFGGPSSGNGRFPAQNMAAIIMHEFGHNLGLRHGGAVDVLFKPNYLSVMNYNFTEPHPVLGDTYAMTYSQVETAPLNEGALDETVGVQGVSDPLIASRVTLWLSEGPDGAGGASAGLIDGAPLDWNGDGDDADAMTAVDLNTFWPAVLPSVFPETHRGFDDWSNIHLPLRGSANFGAFATRGDTTAALPEERAMREGLDIVAAIDGASPCPADLNGDGVVDGADLATLLGAWGGGGAPNLNGDGLVDGADLASLLGAWGACP